MYMCEPACSPLNVLWSCFPMMTKFGSALFSLCFIETVSGQAVTPVKASALTLQNIRVASRDTYRLEIQLYQNQALVAPLLTVLRIFLRISALVPSRAQTFSTSPSLCSSLYISAYLHSSSHTQEMLLDLEAYPAITKQHQKCKIGISFVSYLYILRVPDAMIHLPISFSCYLLSKQILDCSGSRWEMEYYEME